MTQSDLIVLARATAVRHALLEQVVCGICLQESSWDPNSIRYEKAFQTRYIEPLVDAGKLTDQTEIVCRAISWGLMQLIGESARELGFTGKFPELCDPATGIEWGCQWFSRKLAAAGGDYSKALLLWNGGGNQDYAVQVMQKAQQFVT